MANLSPASRAIGLGSSCLTSVRILQQPTLYKDREVFLFSFQIELHDLGRLQWKKAGRDELMNIYQTL
jgi:hypothetical protein